MYLYFQATFYIIREALSTLVFIILCISLHDWEQCTVRGVCHWSAAAPRFLMALSGSQWENDLNQRLKPTETTSFTRFLELSEKRYILKRKDSMKR